MKNKLTSYVKNKNETLIVSRVRKDYVKKYAKFLIKKGNINDNSTLVDVPCGTGDMAKAIVSLIKVKRIILFDINSNMIKSAKEKIKENMSFVLGDGANISDLIKEKVDTIICLNGFHQYIQNKNKFLMGCSKILNHKGRLILDIATRGLNDDYTKKFFKTQKSELIREVRKYKIRPTLPIWVDKKIINSYDKMILKNNLNIKEKVIFTTWYSTNYILKNQIIIPGRSLPWLKGLDYKKRKNAFIKATKKTINKIGNKKIEHNRIFYIITKQ